MRDKTSFIFDLDGTLTDSVYQNVAAWKEALDAENIPLAMWRIHRKNRNERWFDAQCLVSRDGYGAE